MATVRRGWRCALYRVILPVMAEDFRELAAVRLAAFSHRAVDGMRRAAVVLCVREQAGVLSVLMILRASRGRNAGQWALPGGRVEDGETYEEAALREVEEEIGLSMGPAELIGRLDDFPAVSGFAITPFVAMPRTAEPLEPNPDEVEFVHAVPLDALAADDVARWAPQPEGDPLLQLRIAPDSVVHAPTGAILWQFREVVLLGRETRVADFRQPDWTRR